MSRFLQVLNDPNKKLQSVWLSYLWATQNKLFIREADINVFFVFFRIKPIRQQPKLTFLYYFIIYKKSSYFPPLMIWMKIQIFMPEQSWAEILYYDTLLFPGDERIY